MFGLFSSPEKKLRSAAAGWLELAAKVWNYRRDRLSEADAGELRRRRAELGGVLARREGPEQLKAAMQSLETVLRRTGGAVFPVTPLRENVEFFLVAAIVIIGIRTFFLQPMVIPTNSMWPTYYGLTAENHPPGTKPPNLAERAFRLVAYGAWPEEVDAPAAGEVSALFIVDAAGRPHPAGTPVAGRKWLFFPARYTQYTFFIDGKPATLRLPEDFHDYEQVLMDTYFHNDTAALVAQWKRADAEHRIRPVMVSAEAGQEYRAYAVPLGKTVQAGDPLLRFDLMKGDMLVVDRVSYNFVRPKVGSGFVFETGRIPGITLKGYPDEFFIKRLVGVPGDTLEIREPVLYRNGKPIEGAAAFTANAHLQGKYRGYFNPPEGAGEYLMKGETLTVPPHSFFAMGDNSAISEDGRYWGFVPAKEVMGRPLFIYYPFTRRWGLAR